MCTWFHDSNTRFLLPFPWKELSLSVEWLENNVEEVEEKEDPKWKVREEQNVGALTMAPHGRLYCPWKSWSRWKWHSPVYGGSLKGHPGFHPRFDQPERRPLSASLHYMKIKNSILMCAREESPRLPMLRIRSTVIQVLPLQMQYKNPLNRAKDSPQISLQRC